MPYRPTSVRFRTRLHGGFSSSLRDGGFGCQIKFVGDCRIGVERFSPIRVVSTASVAADIRQDGPWMFSMLQSELGPAGPKRLIVPEPLSEPMLRLGGALA